MMDKSPISTSPSRMSGRITALSFWCGTMRISPKQQTPSFSTMTRLFARTLWSCPRQDWNRQDQSRLFDVIETVSCDHRHSTSVVFYGVLLSEGLLTLQVSHVVGLLFVR